MRPDASGDSSTPSAPTDGTYLAVPGAPNAVAVSVAAPTETDAIASSGVPPTQPGTREPVPVPGAERRGEPRVRVRARVGLYVSANVQAAELRDLGLSGAFIATSPATLAAGAGLRLEFTLPQGFHVNVFGRVVWTRAIESKEGPEGYGIQFFGLDDLNREFIQYHLDCAKKGDTTPIVGGRIQTRFEVSGQGHDRLLIRMSGTLTPIESEGLEQVVCRRLAELKCEPTFVYIDARELGPCSRAALEHIRTWLERLHHNRQVLGVLVGTNTIGVVQLRRLAREVRLADGLMTFAEEAEAQAFWETLVSSGAAAVG